jgi:protease PrsW
VAGTGLQQQVLTPATLPIPWWIRRLAWLWVLIGGVVAYFAELHALKGTGNPNFFPSLLLLGALVVPLSVLTFANTSGRSVTAPLAWVVGVVLVGGILGTLAAGTLEYDALRDLPAPSMVLVGLIEESSKLVVPVAVMFLIVARFPFAGVVIGVASGAGFAVLETMGYGFTALLEAGSLAAVDETLMLRALLVPAGHVAWTGVTMAAIWRIPAARRRGRALALAFAAFLASVLLHAAWDGSGSTWVHVVIGAASALALVVTIHLVHVHQTSATQTREATVPGQPVPEGQRGP